jgi:hypothetical protein
MREKQEVAEFEIKVQNLLTELENKLLQWFNHVKEQSEQGCKKGIRIKI